MKTNTHFRNTILFCFIAFTFINCKVDNQENEIFNLDYEKFHGKYKIIKSTANELIDMNFDGKLSNNLITEIIDLKNSELQLRIYKGGYLFLQTWEEPSFPKTYDVFPTVFDPENIPRNYMSQGEIHTFEFTSDYKTIKVIRSQTSGSTDYKWTLPQSVNIVGDELIEIITNRKMYTSDGIKMIKITSLYKRYQKST
jgi:hypothetical protein